MINKSPAGVRCTKVLSCTRTASLDSENSGVDPLCQESCRAV
jgi:hypothetical protein